MPLPVDDCKTILVVSPHLDDGVLSVGGLIERAVANGSDVIVATAFTADVPPDAPISPLATELHALWNLGASPYAHRRAEDIASVALLGARIRHGGLLDALYRTDEAGAFLYPTRQSIFSPPADRDPVGKALVDLLGSWIDEFSPDLVLAPLGVGRHADHIVTTTALCRLAGTRPVPLALYEDMPYATGLFPLGSPDNVEAALARRLWPVTTPQLVAVDLPAKLGAIAAYASQIADIFPNGLDFGAVIDRYMRQPDGVYAERLWAVAG